MKPAAFNADHTHDASPYAAACAIRSRLRLSSPTIIIDCQLLCSAEKDTRSPSIVIDLPDPKIRTR